MEDVRADRILITGAAGFLGSHAVTYFLSKGFKVRALTRSEGSRGYFFEHPNLEIVAGDMKNHESLISATRGVIGVIHFASAKQDEKDSFQINVQGAKNLVEACRQNNVRCILNVSTSSTKIKIRGVYGETKKHADEIFMQSGIPTTTLKPSLIYGDLKSAAFGSLIKFSRLFVTPVFGSGKCKFRPIYIDDVMKALLISLQDQTLRNKTYDVVGPELISMNDLIMLIGNKLLHKRVKIVHVPAQFGFIVAKVLSLFIYKSPITKSNILGSTQNVEMDYKSFINDFKFNPISLQEGLDIIEKESRLFDEANLILSYAASRSFPKIKITERETQLYYSALSHATATGGFSNLIYSHPFLLGPLEFLSQFYPNSTLSKKIYVALTILECSPSSAEWLLPKKRSLVVMTVISVSLTCSFLVKVILAGPLILFPNFVKRNVV